MQLEITQHLREVRAQWMTIEVGDKRVSQVEEHLMEEVVDDDFALDEVRIMNLENMMEE